MERPADRRGRGTRAAESPVNRNGRTLRSFKQLGEQPGGALDAGVSSALHAQIADDQQLVARTHTCTVGRAQLVDALHPDAGAILVELECEPVPDARAAVGGRPLQRRPLNGGRVLQSIRLRQVNRAPHLDHRPEAACRGATIPELEPQGPATLAIVNLADAVRRVLHVRLQTQRQPQHFVVRVLGVASCHHLPDDTQLGPAVAAPLPSVCLKLRNGHGPRARGTHIVFARHFRAADLRPSARGSQAPPPDRNGAVPAAATRPKRCGARRWKQLASYSARDGAPSSDRASHRSFRHLDPARPRRIAPSRLES